MSSMEPILYSEHVNTLSFGIKPPVGYRHRFVLSLLLAAITLCLFIGSDAHARSMEYYKQNGVVITTSPIWKPYSFLGANDEPQGFLIDYWKKWSEKTGIPVEFVMLPWKDTIDRVRGGQADIQSGLYFTEERAKFLNYSYSFYAGKAVLVVRKDYDCSSVSGESRWGATAGTYEEGYLRRTRPNADVRTYQGANVLMQALVRGEVDAIGLNLSSVMLIGKDLRLNQDITVCDILYERKIFGGVRKDDPELVEIVNTGMDMISENEMRQITDRWFVTPHSSSWLVRGLLIAAIIVFLGLFVRMWTARR